MKIAKYLLIPWFILTINVVLSVYNGTAGIVPYRELQSERQKILENLEKLQFINQELEGRMNALRYDSETIRIKARELGYGEYGERFVRIVGVPGGQPNELKAGTIRAAVQPSYSGKDYRVVSFCIGFFIFVLFLTGDFLIKKETERRFVLNHRRQTKVYP